MYLISVGAYMSVSVFEMCSFIMYLGGGGGGGCRTCAKILQVGVRNSHNISWNIFLKATANYPDYMYLLILILNVIFK